MITSGLTFPARDGHSTVYANGVLLSIGGINQIIAFSDVWALSFTSATSGSWSQVATTGSFPARAFHSSAYDASNNLIYIVAGLFPIYPNSLTRYSDMWVLNANNYVWTQLPVTLGSGGVFSHTSQFVKGQVYISCGTYGSPVGITALTYVYNPSSNSLTTLPTSGSFTKRYQHSSA